MAAKSQDDSDDGFSEVKPGSDYDEDDVEPLTLESGEKFQGTIFEYNPDVGYNGLVKVRREDGDEDRIKYWLNGQVRSRFDQAGVDVGDRVRVTKTTEKKTYTDDDGKEHSYDVFRVAVDN